MFWGKKIKNKSLDFLFFDIFQDCKFLETSTKMFHLWIKTLIVDKRHVYESCEKFIQKGVEMNE
jgi:hypothetical protein